MLKFEEQIWHCSSTPPISVIPILHCICTSIANNLAKGIFSLLDSSLNVTRVGTGQGHYCSLMEEDETIVCTLSSS